MNENAYRARAERGRSAVASSTSALPHRGPARGEGEPNDTDARLWHPWLRINRVLRVMLRTRWSAEFTKAHVSLFRTGRAAPRGLSFCMFLVSPT
jgi:hypothetical protein